MNRLFSFHFNKICLVTAARQLNKVRCKWPLLTILLHLDNAQSVFHDLAYADAYLMRYWALALLFCVVLKQRLSDRCVPGWKGVKKKKKYQYIHCNKLQQRRRPRDCDSKVDCDTRTVMKHQINGRANCANTRGQRFESRAGGVSARGPRVRQRTSSSTRHATL